MKKCSLCGSDLPEGEVFCPKCGQEVQLVPDYETMGSRLMEQQKRQKEEEERQQEEARKAAEEARQKKKRTKKSILIIVLILIAAVVVLFTVKALNDQKNHNSFEYQLKKAETAYSNSNYESALDYVTRALALQGDSLDARMLLAQIYEKTGDLDGAAELFLKIITDHPDYDNAYGMLIKLYETMEEPQKIKDLLDACMYEQIKEKYQQYICEAPIFSLRGGHYDEMKTLVMKADTGATIYYTLDGTAPDKSSKKYVASIKLEEGITTVRAIAINSLGIESEETEATYTIKLKVPPAPEITPKDGSYTSKTVSKITVTVPDGYTAYYAFDEKPTIGSTLYTEPVAMIEGAHIFYAILVNQEGTMSPAASVTYIYTQAPEPTAAPTRRPTPEPTRAPAHSSTTEKPEDLPPVTSSSEGPEEDDDPSSSSSSDTTDTPTPDPSEEGEEKSE